VSSGQPQQSPRKRLPSAESSRDTRFGLANSAFNEA
jgi:hypothetical protein